jgi:hypothetical protein
MTRRPPVPDTGRYSRPALEDGAPPQRPLTVDEARGAIVEARGAIVEAADRYRAEGGEKAAWELDKAAFRLIAVTYELEGVL